MRLKLLIYSFVGGRGSEGGPDEPNERLAGPCGLTPANSRIRYRSGLEGRGVEPLVFSPGLSIGTGKRALVSFLLVPLVLAHPVI
jgi:hypothetical protein